MLAELFLYFTEPSLILLDFVFIIFLICCWVTELILHNWTYFSWLNVFLQYYTFVKTYFIGWENWILRLEYELSTNANNLCLILNHMNYHMIEFVSHKNFQVYLYRSKWYADLKKSGQFLLNFFSGYEISFSVQLFLYSLRNSCFMQLLLIRAQI